MKEQTKLTENILKRNVFITETQKKKKLKWIIAAACALLTAAVIVIQLVTPGFLWMITPKARAKDGVIEALDGIEHIKQVPKGEIRYTVNNNVTFKSDSAKGNFMFENPEACEYTLQFSVYEIVGDGGEENLIYTSPMIAPGQFVYRDKLSKAVDGGTYNCVYFARAYLNGEYAGERSGDMTVNVLK